MLRNSRLRWLLGLLAALALVAAAGGDATSCGDVGGDETAGSATPGAATPNVAMSAAAETTHLAVLVDMSHPFDFLEDIR